MNIARLCALCMMMSTAFHVVFSQPPSVSITIDDVPNTTDYAQNNFTPHLLTVLDSLDIPYTIFINEEKLFKTDSLEANKELLSRWIAHDRSLIGNHTYSHSRFSDVGTKLFIEDINKGEYFTREYASQNNKELIYFRFPFNDLGNDSTGHTEIIKYLASKGYVSTPFTVESSDWMFDTLYRHYLAKNELDSAKVIGELYVDKTLSMIEFFDEMSRSIYGRAISQIYLCHDNALNADYLDQVIAGIKEMQFAIVSLEESLRDPVYNQEDHYYKKWGISWLYRWMETQEERLVWMRQEPDLSWIEKTYTHITD